MDVIEQRNAAVMVEKLEEQNAQLRERLNQTIGKKLAKASTSAITVKETVPFTQFDSHKNYLLGYVDPSNTRKRNYHDTLKLVRWFYSFDPIAGTVINRMADMSMTVLRNRKKTKTNAGEVPDDVMAYYDALADELKPFLKSAALEYLIHGMALPEYTTKKVRGDLISDKLGRTRFTTIDQIWLRDPMNIVLRKRPVGTDRYVLFKVPDDEINFVLNNGKRSDGTVDTEGYQMLVENFPAYVAAIKKGQRLFPLDNMHPIYRKLTTFDDYPIPFLQNALTALQHKEYIKTMDRSIANRAIEAIRLIKTGDKDFPADDEDITALESQVTATTSTGDRIYNLFTNHTVSIEWIFPPLEALLNDAKYSEPNSDIFLGLGFPRILTVGETAKSNAADNKIASLGPKATLDDMREVIIYWLKKLYRELADLNGFKRIPDPYFAPIATTDMTALVQFAIEAQQSGSISKDTVAQLYGSDFETEAGQIAAEIDMNVLSPAERATQQQQDFQMQQTQMNQDFTMKMSAQNQNNNAPNNNNKNTKGN